MPEIHTIKNKLSHYSDYISERNSHLKTLENPRLLDGRDEFSVIHADKNSNPNPTIGYGYNLAEKSLAQNTAFFTLAFGGTLSATQTSALNFLENWQEGIAVTINGAPKILTNQDIIDGAAGTIPELAALDSLKLTEAQASIMLNAYLEGIPDNDGIPLFVGAEDGLDAALAGIDFVPSNPDVSKLPESKERLALLSMYYQLPELIGPGLIAALQDDNRAEAWFQIRYKHLNFSNVGLQDRKNTESNLFGLTRTEDLDEYAEALAYLYTNHRQTIDERDANSPFLDAIATQKTALESAYTYGEPVDFIYMGTDSSTHQDKLGGNDLIFGDATAASTLHGDSEPVRPRTALLSTYEICRNSCRNFCRNFFRTANFLRFVLPARLISIFAVLDSCSSARQTQDFSSKDRQRIHGRGSVCQAKENCT